MTPEALQAIADLLVLGSGAAILVLGLSAGFLEPRLFLILILWLPLAFLLHDAGEVYQFVLTAQEAPIGSITPP